MNEICVDSRACVSFLTEFFRGTKETVELRALPSKARVFTRESRKALDFIETHGGENVYFGCATRKGGGDKGHCREVAALWVDVDFKTTTEQRARELLAALTFPPSIVIESGGGLHLYWLLAEPVPASDPRIEPILRGLAQALGGDRVVAEIAHIMRLPWSVNRKYDPPRQCKVSEAQWERRYALSDFEKYTEHSAASAQPNPHSGEKVSQGRHRYLVSLAGVMRARGASQAAIEAALLADNAARCNPPKPQEEVRRIARDIGCKPPGTSKSGGPVWENPWEAAEGMETFLGSGSDVDVPLHAPILFRERVTEIFSPRGIGKSLYALFLAVSLASKGLRVLLLDRDNSKRDVRKRLRAWGADPRMKTLKALGRDKCPPLTRPELWAMFPYSEYDVVILDSLDSMAEGVGEQDSAKPSRAIAPLLDIVRRDNGPSVLVLGNTVRTGKHSRGSGVIEDRSDIAFEVRDLTGFHPSGNKPWWEELPPADAGSWAARTTRRKHREKYRLAFVASKFRGDQEPAPFILEIDLTTSPWNVEDVTDQVDVEGAAERDRRAKEEKEKIDIVTEALLKEILRRRASGEPAMLKDRDAIAFLKARGLTRNVARDVVNRSDAPWKLEPLTDQPGHPVALMSGSKNEDGGGNTTASGTAKTQTENDADFRRAHEQEAAEIWPHDPQCPSESDQGRISAEDSFFTPPENDDGEVVL